MVSLNPFYWVYKSLRIILESQATFTFQWHDATRAAKACCSVYSGLVAPCHWKWKLAWLSRVILQTLVNSIERIHWGHLVGSPGHFPNGADSLAADKICFQMSFICLIFTDTRPGDLSITLESQFTYSDRVVQQDLQPKLVAQIFTRVFLRVTGGLLGEKVIESLQPNLRQNFEAYCEPTATRSTRSN